MDDFEKAEGLLDQIEDCRDYGSFWQIPPLIGKLRTLMEDYQVEHFHFENYFRGHLSLIESFANSLAASGEEKL